MCSCSLTSRSRATRSPSLRSYTRASGARRRLRLDLADPVVAGQQVACCSHTVALMSRIGADAALFDAAGLLTPRCVMAHAIHLEQARRTAATSSRPSSCPAALNSRGLTGCDAVVRCQLYP